MNKNQAITVAIGAGTVGTILAFLGFSYYKNHVEPKAPSSDDVGEKANVKLEVKEHLETVKSDDGPGGAVKSGKKEAWGQFWKGAYEDKNLVDTDSELEKEKEV